MDSIATGVPVNASDVATTQATAHPGDCGTGAKSCLARQSSEWERAAAIQKSGGLGIMAIKHYNRPHTWPLLDQRSIRVPTIVFAHHHPDLPTGFDAYP
ncbi:hypothetical protein K227x_17290 [Rubripirellula lacrimiformis]|uniref:Uncharacterized protein n=1 Tax=Rubripirellula lacrimiformis TaxID=1930273 RepID=A0A517N881_9BACT|nr:hypothetical protein [Rubripirellula lacrimiformis]QDT03347.1 hypothetical protein K227x_17290 [Rubripirellula lacrimiformis]